MHTEAVWSKFNTLTNNNPQIWPCLQLYAACALLAPANKEFQTVGHCFGPACLLDLLHNPKCTGSSLYLDAPIYGSGKDVLIISFFSEQLGRFTPFQRSSLKIPVFLPLSLAHMWLTPTLVAVLIYD